MNKADYIEYWRFSAEKDWDAVGHLFQKGDYLHALFFAHLVLEKLLKAHYVKDNTLNFAPRSHNLIVLVSQTQLNPTPDQLKLMSQVNQFNIDGRYPDYNLNMFRIATATYTRVMLDEIEHLRIWLVNQLPSKP